MNRIPRFSPPPLGNKADLVLTRQVREYRLITPLFGGGVDPREADPISTVRATEVRGQLRFWWRATRGGQFGENLAAMKAAEDLLWGAASTKERDRPSLVQVEVTLISAGMLDEPFEVYEDVNRQGQRVYRTRPRRGSLVPAYAAFPLQPTQDTLRNWDPRQDTVDAVRSGVAFRLTLTYPTMWADGSAQLFPGGKAPPDEVAAALWAWEICGGLGARTRRGFGALQCLQINGTAAPLATVDSAEQDLRTMLSTFGGTWPRDVPHLDAHVALRVVSDDPQPEDSWRRLIEALRRFRQARNRRDDQPNRPGRSRWPEPDEIRRRVPKRYTRHADPISEVRAFPRAAFGLPIIFHFQDQREDPGDTTLKGVSAERLASPLILRPLACQGRRSVGLALVLQTPRIPTGGLILDGARPGVPIRIELTPDEARSITDGDRRPLLKGETDVLQAFLNYLER